MVQFVGCNVGSMKDISYKYLGFELKACSCPGSRCKLVDGLWFFVSQLKMIAVRRDEDCVYCLFSLWLLSEEYTETLRVFTSFLDNFQMHN